MSKKLDERVVEIKFDNRDFESNASTTMSTLDKLEEKLKLEQASKGLENVDKAAKRVDLSSVSAAAESTGQSFSALEVMGVTALANLTNAAVNFGKSLIRNVVSPITSGGLQRALNIEQASFQLEGLGISKSDSNSYYTEVMNAVLGTAYSYDVAAKAASQLAASNIGVTESTKTLANGQKVVTKVMNGEMTEALLGMAGVASMTGSDFDSISQIFTRVAGQGRVMANDLNSLASRGLNAAATLGEALGVSEAEVRDMVSKGQISFEMFSKAMSDAFGAHAKDSTKMYTGALEDAKAALARIGADFFGPVLESGRDAWNAFTPFVDAVHTVLGDSNTGAIGAATKSIENLSNKLQVVLRVATYSMSTFGDSQNLAKSTAMSAIEALSKEAKIGKSTTEIIQDLANIWNVDFKEAERRLNDGEVALYQIDNALQKTSKSYKNAAEVSQLFTDTIQGVREERGWTLVKISDAMGLSAKANNEIIRRLSVNGVDGLKLLGKQLDKTSDEVQSMIDTGKLGFDQIDQMMKKAIATGDLTQKQYDDAYKKIRTDFIYQQNDALKDLVNNTYYFVDAIRETTSVIKTLFGLAAKLVTPFLKVVVAYGKIIFEITAATMEGFAGLLRQITGLENAGDNLFTKINKFTDKLIISDDVINGIIDTINTFFESVSPRLENLTNKVKTLSNDTYKIVQSNIFPKIEKLFTTFKTGVKDLATIAKDSGLLQTAFSLLAVRCGTLSKTLPGIIAAFLKSDAIAKGFDKLNVALAVVFKYLNGIINDIADSKIFDLIKEGLNAVDKLLEKILSNKTVTKILDAIGTGLTKLVNALKILFNKIGATELVVKIFDKLSDTLHKLFSDETIDKGIDLLVAGIGKLFESLSNLFTSLSESNAVEKLDEAIVSLISNIEKLDGQTFTNITNKLNGLFSKDWRTNGEYIAEGLSSGIFGAAQKVFEVVADIATNIINVFNNILGINSPSKVFYAIGGFIIAGLVGGLSGNMDQVSDIAGRLCETLVDKIEKLDVGALMVDSLLGGALITLYQMNRTAQMTVSPISNLGKAFKELALTMRALKISLQLQIDSLAILNLGLALVSVANGLKILSTIPADSVTNVIKLLGTVTIALGALMLSTKAMKGNGLGASAVFLSIGVVFTSLAKTLKTIVEIPEDQMEKATDGLALLWIFIASLTAISGFAGSKLIKVETTFKALGVVLLTVAAVFLSIGITFTNIALAMKMISKIPEASIEQSKRIIGHIGVFVAAIMGLSTFKVKDVLTVAALFGSISALFLSIAIAFKIVSKIKPEGIQQASGVMTWCAILVAGLMIISDIATDKDISGLGRMFAGISTLFITMSIAIKIISGIQEGLGKAILTITWLTILIGALVAVSNLAAKGELSQVGKMMEGIGKAFLMISASILILTILDPAKMAGATAAVTIIMGMLALIASKASIIEKAKNIIVAMSIVLGVIAGSLFIIGQLDTARVLIAAGSIAGIIAELVIVFNIINKMTIGKGLVGKILLMDSILVVIAVVIAKLVKDIGPENANAAMTICKALALTMGSFAAVLLGLSLIGKIGVSSALPALGVMGLVIAAFAMVLEVIADKAEYCKTVLDKAGPILLEFGDLIAKFFEKLILGFAIEGIKDIGDSIADFVDKTAGMGDSISKFKDFISTIGELKDVLPSVGNNGVNAFVILGNGISQFIKKIKKIKDVDIEAVTKRLTDLFKSFGSLSKDDIAAGVANLSNAFEIVASSSISSFKNRISSKDTIKDLADSCNTLFSSVADKIKKTEEKNGLFKSIGELFSKGLATGINSTSSVTAVTNAANSIGSTATATLRKYGIIKSPSRLWMKVGKYFGEGLAIGIDNTADDVSLAAKNLADTSTNSLRNTISRINSIVADGIDTTPTITPVLDLNGVTSSADRLNSMFNRNQALEISANLRSKVDSADKIQNGISELKKVLTSQSTGPVYNIGDVKLEVSKLSDAATLEDIVTIFRKAKAYV